MLIEIDSLTLVLADSETFKLVLVLADSETFKLVLVLADSETFKLVLVLADTSKLALLDSECVFGVAESLATSLLFPITAEPKLAKASSALISFSRTFVFSSA